MKDGRTHLAHKAEHGVDLETGDPLGDGAGCVGGRFGDSAGDADDGGRAGRGGAASARRSEVVADKGYHQRRWWLSTRLGFAVTSRSRSGVGAVGRQEDGRRRRRSVLRRRHYMGTVGVFAATEVVVFNAATTGGAACRTSTGGLRRVWVRGENVRNGCSSAAGCNLGQLLRRRPPSARPGACRGALSGCGLIGPLTALWGRLTASWDFQWTPAGRGSIAHRQAA